MARYIDADKLIDHLKDEIKACEPKFDGRANGKSVAYGTELGLKSAISFVETLATADVVEVVRCRDCKHFGKDLGYGKHDCKKYEMPYCLENDYCSYGERKE